MLNYLDSTQFASNASYTLSDKIKVYCPLLVGNEISASSPSGKNAIFLGLWRHLFIMLWGSGIELTFDRFTAADSFTTGLRANILANVGINFPSAFVAVRQN